MRRALILNRKHMLFGIIDGDIVKKLQVPRKPLFRLLSDLSPEMAIRLSAVLGGSPESWLRLQENYDLWKAKEKVNTEKLNRIDFDAVA